MKDAVQILREYWKYDSFRPLQREIINSILEKKDTLAILPTGGGKSICFQVPALASEGLCLVISPLIALMKDQVENLRKKGITALSIFSGMSRKEVVNTLKIAGNSNCKFLYVSPERLQTNLFKEYVPSLGISLIAVDEAHCISQWGYDFRPPYLKIAELRKELPNVPVLALTASATPIVQKDICEKLLFREENIFRQSFERANLSYSVFNIDSKLNKILEILNNVPGTGIVYCRSRKNTKEIAQLLKLNNINASFYHAGLPQEERNQKQQAWINNEIRVIVCTNAFGMGIDKPDVRTVVHVDIPDCVENYYQEAGRAGRDGKKAYAVLLYREKELKELEEQIETQFPSEDQIKSVYQALMNYLQLPAGSGRETYFDFDLRDFIKKFPFDLHTVMSSMKVMQQEEIIGYNEIVFQASTVQFTTSKKYLFEFEQTYPQSENIIKTLLRTYEGIFDFPVTISEKLIASLIKTDESKTKEQLLFLHKSGIIEYNPQKDNPQVYCFTDRARTEDLKINLKNLEARKKVYRERIEKMISYVTQTKKCRASFIAEYFGEKENKDCNVCDICLKKRSAALTETEFVDIHMRLLKLLQRPLHSKDLIRNLYGIRKEKAWEVIDLLQAENKIVVDEEGWIKKI